MNIFFLDSDPVKAAHYHVNKHVVKMIVESVQCLSTTHRRIEGEYLSERANDILYKTTHVNHPCNVWLRQSKTNYAWLTQLTAALFDEWVWRYNNHTSPEKHKSYPIFQYLSENFPKNLSDSGMTPVSLAMPDEYKVVNNPVISYRNYYRGSKSSMADWGKRGQPLWWVSSE